MDGVFNDGNDSPIASEVPVYREGFLEDDNGLYFDGGDVFGIQNNTTFQAQEFSVSFWMNISSLTTSTIISHNSGVDDNGYKIILDSGNKIELWVYTNQANSFTTSNCNF